MKQLTSALLFLAGVALVVLALSACCKTKPPVYLPPAPSLTNPPPAKVNVPRVAPDSPDVYRCFSRDGTWDLVMYINALRTYAEEAWTKCGVTDDGNASHAAPGPGTP